ncbi:MAG: hypothetical protein KGH62_04205, partial [Candidatus Micrarchaeota archaeon]|nr:hypothetical protein [Candidatus Micrarchaeota archaeon]
MPQEPSGQEPYKPKQSTSAVNLVNGLPLRPIIIAAVIILAIVLAYSFLSGNSQSSRYARLAAALSAGKPVTLAAVASTLSANTGSLSGLINSSSNLSYSGSGGLSAQITGLSLSIPFSYALTEQTNGSYSRADSKISIMHSALSEILINTPNITYECSDKNQSSGLLSGILGGNQSSTGTEHPDYACVASAPINISNSYSMQANEIINRILNNSFMNATKVSYTSTYMHRSCIFMAGYIYSNKINLGALVNTSSSSGAVSGTQASLLAPNDTLSFKGPYSLCASQS